MTGHLGDMRGDRLRRATSALWRVVLGAREPLLVFAATRGGLFLLAYVSLATLPLNQDPAIAAPGAGPWRGFPGNLLLDGWGRWDAGWYVHIATQGYVDQAVDASGQRNLAFYPLYPLTMWIVSLAVRDPLVAGLLVSNLAFLGTLVLLHRMTRSRFGPDAAFRCLLLLSVFPFSFYLSAVYSEALFLFLVVSAFYLAEQDRWWAASICAMLSGATRPPGLALTPALGLLYLEKVRFDRRRVRPNILWLGLGVLGPVLFFTYLYVQLGDPWLQIRATRVGGWWASGINLKPAKDALKALSSVGKLGTGRFPVVFDLNLLVAGLSLVTVVPVFRRQSPAYGLFSLLIVGSGLLQPRGWGRYVLPAFPLFVAWSLALEGRRAFECVLVVSSLLLALLTILYTHWYWVA